MFRFHHSSQSKWFSKVPTLRKKNNFCVDRGRSEGSGAEFPGSGLTPCFFHVFAYMLKVHESHMLVCVVTVPGGLVAPSENTEVPQ